MGTEFYTIHAIPDLTLAQYSAEESGGVDDVIRQHAAFYRQLNRKGLLFGEIYHLVYVYDPLMQPGKRLNVYLRADRDGESPACMHEFMTASPLSSYFHFEKEEPPCDPVFAYRAVIGKQDGFVSSSFPDKNTGYYTVYPWKANEKARLIGLFRMMQRLQQPAAYSVTVRSVDLSVSMRESFRTQIQYIRNAQKVNMGNRDENAEQCLRIYDKFLESLCSHPHFICRISSYAGQESVARMILDAAASEAVEEGSYRMMCEAGTFHPLEPERGMGELCLDDAPRGMRRWNSLFLLSELVPFAMFPVLYPGETVEIPKESAPVYEKRGIHLGRDRSGYDVYVPLDLLAKHALLAGVPGSGKTYSMLHISSQLSGEYAIPVLVLEPAKKEYRALARNTKMPDLAVFSPGAAGSFPLRINPFEFPAGLKLSEHITNLVQVFEGAFDLTPPMPFLVSEGIEQVYRDHGWYPFEVNDGSRSYPSIRELYDKVAKLLDASDYAPEIRSNLKSCLQVRIGSLITREMGNVFDVPASTLSPEEWLQATCVIELESLGPDAANFLTLLLRTLIRELLRQHPKAAQDRPRHVIFLEEAHNLIGPSTVANAENGDAKVASTKYIVNMLAEVRALREAIVIADQLPTGLAPQITKNTSLKIAHRITAMDDRQLLAATMSADGVQLERMGSFQPGQALCVYENIMKPFEIQISEYDGNAEPPDNDELYEILSDRDIYRKVMERDFEIMNRKFMAKKSRILERYRIIVESGRIMEQNRVVVQKNPTDQKNISKFKSNEEQYMRNIDRLFEDWLEYLLELSDYCKMNMLKRQDGLALVRRDLRELMDVIKELMKDSPDQCAATLGRVVGRIDGGLTWAAGQVPK